MTEQGISVGRGHGSGQGHLHTHSVSDGACSGQGDRDPREAFLPLVGEDKAAAAGRAAAQMSSGPEWTAGKQ